MGSELTDAIISILKKFPTMGMYSIYEHIPKQILASAKKADSEKCLAIFTQGKITRSSGIPIMKQIAAHQAPDFELLFAAFCGFGNSSWTWCDPAENRGSNFVKLLDGDVAEGQCEVFAEALICLATYPPPWGLGLSVESVVKSTYSGHFNEGFVVDESKLRPFIVASRCNKNSVLNVYKPRGQLTNMTCWDNHKTVAYDGSIWDPCYGAKYPAARDIVEFQIRKTGISMPYCDGLDKSHKVFHFVPAIVPKQRPTFSGPWNADEIKKIPFAEESVALVKDGFTSEVKVNQ